jgi:hypothetical protein
MDARGVRTRAYTATELVVENFSGPEHDGRKDIVSASLACGAAGPVFDFSEPLQRNGKDISTFHLFDQDPMALASASAIAEGKGISDKVNIILGDLLTDDLTEHIEEGSVDVVDLLGLFEYIPSDIKIKDLFEMGGVERELTAEEQDMSAAAYILAQAKKLIRPGGEIIFGNMLNERPQQKFFDKVVGWPPLKQRSVTEVLEIVQEAGFDLDNVSARIPSREGVYAVYAIKVPEGESSEDIPTIPRAADKAAVSPLSLPNYA